MTAETMARMTPRVVLMMVSLCGLGIWTLWTSDLKQFQNMDIGSKLNPKVINRTVSTPGDLSSNRYKHPNSSYSSRSKATSNESPVRMQPVQNASPVSIQSVNRKPVSMNTTLHPAHPIPHRILQESQSVYPKPAPSLKLGKPFNSLNSIVRPSSISPSVPSVFNAKVFAPVKPTLSAKFASEKFASHGPVPPVGQYTPVKEVFVPQKRRFLSESSISASPPLIQPFAVVEHDRGKQSLPESLSKLPGTSFDSSQGIILASKVKAGSSNPFLFNSVSIKAEAIPSRAPIILKDSSMSQSQQFMASSRQQKTAIISESSKRVEIPLKPSIPSTPPPPPDGRCNNCFHWRANTTLIYPCRGFCYQQKEVNSGLIDLLIIVTSRHQNRAARNALRDVYLGNKETSLRIRLLFSSGLDPSMNRTEEALLTKEAEHYGDIIKFDFVAGYYSMHFLHLNALLWIYGECSNIRYTVKSTDDVFLDIPGVLRFLALYGNTQLSNVIFGACPFRSDPIRYSEWTKGSKFLLSYDRYPYRYFPGYPVGGGIFMSVEVGKRLLNEASNVRFITGFDDVDVGLTARLAKVCACHITGLHLGYGKFQAPMLKLVQSESPLNCSNFVPDTFLGIHMYVTSDPSWMRQLLRYEPCYRGRLPKVVECPAWGVGTCNDDSYYLPRG